MRTSTIIILWVITTHTTVFQRPLTAVPATVFRKISISILRGTEKRARWVGREGGREGGGEKGRGGREREKKGATGLVCGLLDFKPSPPSPPHTPPLQRTACLFLQFALYAEDRQLDFLACLSTYYVVRLPYKCKRGKKDPNARSGPRMQRRALSPDGERGGGGPPTPPAFE